MPPLSRRYPPGIIPTFCHFILSSSRRLKTITSVDVSFGKRPTTLVLLLTSLKDRIRKYGFHGISHNYVALQAVAHLTRNFRQMKIITCHLGAGASIAAIDHGRSVDTTMGLTPLEGLMMGTRSGDLDPAIVIRLCQDKALSIEEVDRILNRESGLKGLSGISSDFQELEEAANKGNPRAILAIHTFCHTSYYILTPHLYLKLSGNVILSRSPERSEGAVKNQGKGGKVIISLPLERGR